MESQVLSRRLHQHHDRAKRIRHRLPLCVLPQRRHTSGRIQRTRILARQRCQTPLPEICFQPGLVSHAATAGVTT